MSTDCTISLLSADPSWMIGNCNSYSVQNATTSWNTYWSRKCDSHLALQRTLHQISGILQLIRSVHSSNHLSANFVTILFSLSQALAHVAPPWLKLERTWMSRLSHWNRYIPTLGTYRCTLESDWTCVAAGEAGEAGDGLVAPHRSINIPPWPVGMRYVPRYVCMQEFI